MPESHYLEIVLFALKYLTGKAVLISACGIRNYLLEKVLSNYAHLKPDIALACDLRINKNISQSVFIIKFKHCCAVVLFKVVQTSAVHKSDISLSFHMLFQHRIEIESSDYVTV